MIPIVTFALRPLGIALAVALWCASQLVLANTLDRLDVAQTFAQEFSQKYRIPKGKIIAWFAQVRQNDRVVRLITPKTKGSRTTWPKYRKRFINNQRINQGVRFWRTHEQTLNAAEKRYGVPVEIIIAIIGVETHYGANTGGFSPLEALGNIVFRSDIRHDYFRQELESLLLLAAAGEIDPIAANSSYAGAVGIPQFMPSNITKLAVDFDQDDRIDIEHNPVDAIGSVANYLHHHGWQLGGDIAWPLTLRGVPPGHLLAPGVQPTWRSAELQTHGVELPKPTSEKMALIEFYAEPEADYLIGFHNFSMITRYNKSRFYARAVYELAQKISERYAYLFR